MIGYLRMKRQIWPDLYNLLEILTKYNMYIQNMFSNEINSDLPVSEICFRIHE